MRPGRLILRSVLVILAVVALSGAGSLAFAVFPFATGIRLDLDEGTYVVRWTSDEFGSEHGDDVTYGPTDGSWNKTASGHARTTMVWADSLRWIRPLRVHEARLEGLEPGGEYRYQVPEATPRTFRVPVNGSVRVVALGDVGVSGEAAQIVSLAANERPHLAVVAGDLAYASGNAEGWSQWLEMMEPLAGQAPLLPARGNHEVEPPFGSRLLRAHFPGHGSYYSYDAGPAHFVHLDTEISLSDEGEARGPGAKAREEAQAAWLRDDLATAREEGAPWIVAVFHEPAYSSGRVHGSNPAVRAAWGPIFDEFGVELVIQAHEHSYERSLPMRAGAPVEDNGTVYLVTGGGGRRLYERFVEPAPAWSARRIAVHEFIVLDITEEAIRGRAVGSDGVPIDEFTLRAYR